MSDTLKTTHCVEIGDKHYDLPRMTLADLASVSDRLKTIKEKVAKELAKEMKLDRIDEYNIVVGIRTSPLSLSEIYSWSESPAGASVVLRKSMEKAKIENIDALLESIHTPDAVFAAKNLVLDVKPEPEPEQPKN